MQDVLAPADTILFTKQLTPDEARALRSREQVGSGATFLAVLALSALSGSLPLVAIGYLLCFAIAVRYFKVTSGTTPYRTTVYPDRFVLDDFVQTEVIPLDHVAGLYPVLPKHEMNRWDGHAPSGTVFLIHADGRRLPLHVSYRDGLEGALDSLQPRLEPKTMVPKTHMLQLGFEGGTSADIESSNMRGYGLGQEVPGRTRSDMIYVLTKDGEVHWLGPTEQSMPSIEHLSRWGGMRPPIKVWKSVSGLQGEMEIPSYQKQLDEFLSHQKVLGVAHHDVMGVVNRRKSRQKWSAIFFWAGVAAMATTLAPLVGGGALVAVVAGLTYSHSEGSGRPYRTTMLASGVVIENMVHAEFIPKEWVAYISTTELASDGHDSPSYGGEGVAWYAITHIDGRHIPLHISSVDPSARYIEDLKPSRVAKQVYRRDGKTLAMELETGPPATISSGDIVKYGIGARRMGETPFTVYVIMRDGSVHWLGRATEAMEALRLVQREYPAIKEVKQREAPGGPDRTYLPI